jgi:murein L,D-transpeptidase YcbB/YkuD
VSSIRTDVRRLAVGLVALAVIATALLVAPAAASARAASPTEAAFVSRLNAARTAHGVARLAVRAELVAVARAQSARMARRAVLYHNPHLTTEVRNFRWVGENVGYGPTSQAVHAAFMNSPLHRANILDTDYTEVGIGTTVVNGVVWVAEVFRRPQRVARPSLTRTLGPGSHGPAVRQVQTRLRVPVTGTYDAETRRAVARFQRAQGWAGRGRVGQHTWARLF